MCEGKEVTKISLVPLDSCAYTSEELIIPSAKYTLIFGASLRPVQETTTQHGDADASTHRNWLTKKISEF